MPTQPKPRTTQAQIKHRILDRYLAVWGRIILNGLGKSIARVRASGRRFDVHFVYVDCNAFSGRYPGELVDVVAGRPADTVYGSPVIGVQALDRLAEWARDKWGIEIRVNAVLIEMHKRPFAELQESLRDAGLGGRVRQTTDFAALRPGEIAVVNDDWRSLVDALVAYTETGYTFALYLLDPYGPMAIPLRYASRIVNSPRHDVIINMPYQDLLKKTGLLKKGELSPAEQEICDHYDRMFGGQQWRAIAQNHLALGDLSAANPQALERATTLEEDLAECYRDALLRADPALSVKKVKLHFPDRQRTMYYLYLTTHDATDALEMNKILHEAGQHEHELRERLKQATKVRSSGMVGTLPHMDAIPFALPPRPEEQRPDLADVGERIVRLLDGRRLERPQIYQALADDIYFAGEINRALTQLKREGRAHYEGGQRDKGVVISIGRAVPATPRR